MSLSVPEIHLARRMGAEIEIVSGVAVPLQNLMASSARFWRLAGGSANRDAFTTRRSFPSRMRSTTSSVTIFTGKSLRVLRTSPAYSKHAQAIRDQLERSAISDALCSGIRDGFGSSDNVRDYIAITVNGAGRKHHYRRCVYNSNRCRDGTGNQRSTVSVFCRPS